MKYLAFLLLVSCAQPTTWSISCDNGFKTGEGQAARFSNDMKLVAYRKYINSSWNTYTIPKGVKCKRRRTS